uniref:Reticulon-like protein n=1 Tax=Anthurium amnicola TaxID=1678845 RepID=A0A1D1XYM0_9ARAE
MLSTYLCIRIGNLEGHIGLAVADVMLWRRKNVTVGILLGTLASWIVFEKSGYTLLSLVASVLLVLVSILFVWAKAAAILNRPPPPLPELHLSEEVIKEASVFIHSNVNVVFSAWHDISLGKDNKLFYKVAAFLWLISIMGSWTDFLTLGYTSLLIILTVPALYESYEDRIDNYLITSQVELQQVYLWLDAWLDAACFKVRKWILEKRKLS